MHKQNDKFQRLLAKSLDENANQKALGAGTYTGHIGCVMRAAEVLVELLRERIFEQLAITGFSLEEFSQTVKLGAYLHDWGKANQHFQEMVYLKSKCEKVVRLRPINLQSKYKEHGSRQMLRHEAISGILALQVPEFRKWLEQCPNAKLIPAVWGAIGHHLKAGIGKYGKSLNVAEICDGTKGNLKIFTRSDDFKALLRMGQRFVRLPEFTAELPSEDWTTNQLETALEAMGREFRAFEQQLDWEQKKFIAAVKATVIVADLAGSALPNVDDEVADDTADVAAICKGIQGWIRKVLDLVLEESDLQALINERLKGKELLPFQKDMEAGSRVTIVKAGCGTGKTIGAYAWAKKWARGRKLFFCYPTTGTATQGYIDYADGTEMEATLMHSRADLDRELLFSGDPDDSEGIESQLSAFGTWRKKLTICTVDSVLGLMQNNRRPLCAWAAIAVAAFVFDEVHAYDEPLFGSLIDFLRTFRGAPILLMSASFTPGQLQKIQEVMAEIGEPIHEKDIIKGPQHLEALERYQIHSIEEVSQDLTEVWTSVLEALKNKKKVLWVTNTVKDRSSARGCIDIYRLAKAKLAQELPELGDYPLLIYHSRYRYFDRLNKHEAVINAFKPEAPLTFWWKWYQILENSSSQKPEQLDLWFTSLACHLIYGRPVIAITTQVCEMSLDIDADLLVSAMGPAASLIQRLGRLNRRMTRNEQGARLAIIYPWDNPRPYEAEQLNTGKELVTQLKGKLKISQHNLAEIASRLDLKVPKDRESAWLEHNSCMYPVPLRKGGYTITVLLKEDLSKIKDRAKKRQPPSFMKEAQGWSVPIQMPKDIRKLSEWRRCRFYLIAPSDQITYNEEVGAEPCD